MTEYEVEILGITMDVESNISIPIDFSIADFKEFSSRKRNVSKEIVLSGTDKVVNFFRGTFQFSATENGVSFDPLVKQRASIKKGGKVILLGVAKLNEVQILNGSISFLVNIYSDISDIFLTFQNTKVSELDWSMYNHILNKTNIINSWTATAGSGYYYPLIETGLPRIAPNTFRTRDLVPYIYVKEVIDKAFALVGCTVDSNHLNTNDFRRIIFGYGGGELNVVTPADINNRKVQLSNGTTNFNCIAFSSTNFPTFTTTFNPVTIEEFILTEVQDILDQHQGGEIVIARSGNYTFEVNGILDWLYQVTDGTNTYDADNISALTFGIMRNGSRINTGYIYQVTFGYPPQLSFSTTINYKTTINVQAGDVITFYVNPPSIRYSNAYYNSLEPIVLTATANLQSNNLTLLMTCLDQTVADGDTIFINNVIPDMTISDFITGIVRLKNLYVSDPDENKVVRIEPLSEFYEDISTAKDVSNLVDESKIISIKPIGNEIKKKLSWKFKENKESDALRYLNTYGKRYGDYSFDQQSYYTKGEQVVQLPFSTIIPHNITQNAPFSSSNIFAPRFIKINENGTIQPQKGEPRIMYRTPLVSGSFVLTDSNGLTPTTHTQLPLVHHFNSYSAPTIDLNFQLVEELYYPATTVTSSNSYTENYSIFTNEMISKAGKIITLYLFYNEIDIYNLRFQQLLKINGTVWRLNKVTDFDNSKVASTKFELLKVLQPKKKRTGSIQYEAYTTKAATTFTASFYEWSAVIAQEEGGGIRVEQIINNTAGFNITASSRGAGDYLLSGFANLGTRTEINQTTMLGNNERIVVEIESTGSLSVKTYRGNTLHNGIIPDLENNGYNYILTVKIYQ